MLLYTYSDTHAHLCDEAFSGEEEQILEKAAEAGIKLILQPDIDSSERDRMFALEARFPSMLKSMAGLYPGSVTENWEEEVNAVEKAATSQWSMGGLKAISSPLLTGRIQLPSCSIDMATTASRGSPRVLKGAAPRNQMREMTQRISNGM